MKLKKWCEHIEVMTMKIPLWRVTKTGTYSTGKYEDKLQYVLGSTDVDDYNFCPVCGKAKPKA